MTVPIVEACRGDAACAEVVARLLAADRAAADGYPDIAAQLRATARTYADLHRELDRQQLRPAS